MLYSTPKRLIQFKMPSLHWKIYSQECLGTLTCVSTLRRCFRSAAADHDEHQVSQPSESLVLPKGLHQGGDVLLGVGAAHGQNGRLVGVPQVLTDLLQYQTSSDSWKSQPRRTNDIPNSFLTCTGVVGLVHAQGWNKLDILLCQQVCSCCDEAEVVGQERGRGCSPSILEARVGPQSHELQSHTGQTVSAM